MGPEHPDVAGYQYNIGEAAWLSGDYAAAIPCIQYAIDGLRAETNSGLQHTVVALTTLGYIGVVQNDPRAAGQRFNEAAHSAFEQLSQVLPALAEKEQLSYLASEFRDTLHGWLSLLTAFPDNADVVSRTATWHLNMKASSHELLATQAKLNQQALKGDRPAFQQLLRIREQLARHALKGDNTGPQHKATLARLSAEESRLSRQLGQAATALADPRRWIELADLRDHIPEQSVLVDFARIRQANFYPTSSLDLWNEEHYLAWIIPSAGEGDVIGLDLGPASDIDKRIRSALEASCSPATLRMVHSDGEASAEEQTRSTLEELAALIWLPLQEHLQGFENLVLSPDGQLWTVPREALPVAEGRVLLEDHGIRLVVSGRDMLPKASVAPNVSTVSAPVIVADPLFDLTPTSVQTARTSTPQRKLRSNNQQLSRVFRNAGRLPGTAKEAQAIRDSVSRFAGRDPIVHLQKSAQEGVVKSVHNPHCMVLSTHGFFIAESSDSQAIDKLNSGNRVIENPLLRCGLLLDGCQHADQVPQGKDDGVLTGLEIISTDLNQTQLVVLSACETGLGDVRNGEGIAGLRQAFLLAGSESVVASLWKVDDTATARLMEDFFRNLAEGMSRSAALREAKLSRIRARRERHGAAHPFFWAAFTLTGKE